MAAIAGVKPVVPLGYYVPDGTYALAPDSVREWISSFGVPAGQDLSVAENLIG